MKKRILSLALVLALALSLSVTIAAADDPWFIEWLDASIVSEFDVACEYLGSVSIGGLYHENWAPVDWTYHVIVVDDSVTEIVRKSYFTEKLYDFVNYFDYDMESYIYYNQEIPGVELGYAFTTANNFSEGFEDDPLYSKLVKHPGCWYPQSYIYHFYDPSINEDMWEEEIYEYHIDGISYSYIIFSKSELAHYYQTEQLPKMASSPEGADLSQYVDLTELYALLEENRPEPLLPTPSTVFFNDEAVEFEAYNIESYNYFKLRDLAYVLSGTEKQIEVGYDDATRTVTITTGQPYTPVGIELVPGDGSGTIPAPSKMSILLDGQPVDLTVYLINGNNFFKLRDLMELIDVFVDYDEVTKDISVDTSKGYVK